MPGISVFLENKFMNYIFRSEFYSKPTTLAIALCTGAPVEENTGATIPEVVNNFNYVRQNLPPGDSNWFTVQNGIVANSKAITFSPAGGNWGTITHVAILDDANYGAGNLLFFGPLSGNIDITNGIQFRFNIGYLQVKAD